MTQPIFNWARRSLCLTALGLLMAIVPAPFLAVPAVAQGVPTVDTQNIAQEIQQLRQMIEDEVLQNEQLAQLREQFATLQEQLAQLQDTYAALTGLMELPTVIRNEMEDELNGLLDQEFGDILATIDAIREGDFSRLAGNSAGRIETQMTRVLAEAGFDEDTLREMATGGNDGASRTATRATTGAVMSAAAQTSYEEAGQSLQRVDRLVGMIGDMEELKDSVDLNTRVTAELAIALVAMWQLEAVQTVGTGQTGVIDAAMSISLRFFTSLPLQDVELKFLFGAERSLETDRLNRNQELRDVVKGGDIYAAIRFCVAHKLNMIVSGGTSTGKMVAARKILSFVAPEERIITIEEAAELIPAQPNVVTLLASREGRTRSADTLLTSTLRMRPDRIVLGEVRGSEAMTFLEAINTGHGGSMTTLHAETPQLAIQRLAIAALKTEVPMTHTDMVQYIESSIDVIIHAARHAGDRGITEFYLPGQTGGTET